MTSNSQTKDLSVTGNNWYDSNSKFPNPSVNIGDSCESIFGFIIEYSNNSILNVIPGLSNIPNDKKITILYHGTTVVNASDRNYPKLNLYNVSSEITNKYKRLTSFEISHMDFRSLPLLVYKLFGRHIWRNKWCVRWITTKSAYFVMIPEVQKMVRYPRSGWTQEASTFPSSWEKTFMKLWAIQLVAVLLWGLALKWRKRMSWNISQFWTSTSGLAKTWS